MTFPDALFVAVSTEQNTANLIPLLSFGARRVLLLETARAHQLDWSKGLLTVLQQQQIAVSTCVVPQTTDQAIGFLLRWLIKLVAHEKSVVWIIGGGQTPYRIAPFMAFDQRSIEGHLDYALYSTPPRTIEVLHYEGGVPKQTPVKYQTPPELETIVRCFGRSVEKKEPLRPCDIEDMDLFFNNPDWRHQLYAHRARPEVSHDTLLFDGLSHLEDTVFYEDLNALVTSSLERYQVHPQTGRTYTLREQANFITHRLAKGGLKSVYLSPPTKIETPTRSFRNFGSYFEWILQGLVHQNTSLPAWANVHIFQHQRTESEHDVLLVKHDGTLISLDAKTFDVDRKDLLARLLNMQRIGGSFSQFIPVFPYFIEDAPKMPRELRNLPATLSSYRARFFVVSNETEVHYITSHRGKITRVSKETPGAIRLIPLSVGLRELEQ